MNAEAAPKTAGRKKRGRWAIIAVSVAVLIIAVVAFTTLARPKKSTISTTSTAAASARTINVMVSGSGTAVAADSVTVNPQIDGTVKTLAVSVGDTVTAGDKLYTISSDTAKNAYLKAKGSLLSSKQSVSSARAQLEQNESQLYSARTTKIQAQRKVHTLASLPETSTSYAYNLKIAKRELRAASESVDSAETSVHTAELGLSAALANKRASQNSYNTAKKNNAQTVVTAPIDGVITALPISVGSAVSAGTSSSNSSGSSTSDGSSTTGSSSSSTSGGSGSSITITDMGSMQVEITVSEVDVPKVSVGQKAAITFDAIAGKSFSGKVKSILPNATTSSGVVNYTVYVKLDSIDKAVRTGMTATVDIATQHVTDALAVPSSAVRTEGSTKYVLVVDGSGATQRKDVKVGVSDDAYTQILSGITQGTVVSTEAATATTTSSARGGLGGGPGGPGGN